MKSKKKQILLEKQRLKEAYATDSSKKDWLKWGPYLSERQWGTVREDYSPGGTAWDYFSHDHSRSRAYRWGEDGIAGISDAQQFLCFSLALWNGKDPILKERLFGLTNGEGNHGEDVKEYYYYLDNTPSHSYMKYLYKYPHGPYPYDDLVNTNKHRGKEDFEYELIDTGVFQDDKYFDVQVEYAKAEVEDMLIKISITNHGPESASLHVLPTLLFRNTWSWFEDAPKPSLTVKAENSDGLSLIQASRQGEGGNVEMGLYCEGAEELLFVDNETNAYRLFGASNGTDFPKDGINDYIIDRKQSVRPEKTGTKASASYQLEIASKETKVLRLRLSSDLTNKAPFNAGFEQIFTQRIKEADSFYKDLANDNATEEQKMIQRQAYSGMLWSKQLFYYVVKEWLEGDPVGPPPPAKRLNGRNKDWKHFYAMDVLTMPDKWEYPWFAAWDLCFQTIVFARIDMEFAKNQLRILAHEWYMSPKGQIPAYEWAFGDVNPPLHAWAALQLHRIEKEEHQKAGKTNFKGDLSFLSDIFQHCLMNFTWWSNQQDSENNNLFEGGFLGLDNISILNRSDLNSFAGSIGAKSVVLSQSDGTSWVGMFCLNMMEIANVLTALDAETYSHLSNKFLQYFFDISGSINGHEDGSNAGRGRANLWDEQDQFYYDFLKVNRQDGGQDYFSIKIKSLVGIIALFPVAVIKLDVLKKNGSFEHFQKKMDWVLSQNEEQIRKVLYLQSDQQKENLRGVSDLSSFKTHSLFQEEKILFSFVSPQKLKAILQRVLNETEFLSPHGIRGISKEHETPYHINIEGQTLSVNYQPAESNDGSFGGNSNWRGPVWFPINFMLIEKLGIYHEFYGDSFTVEFPSGSGRHLNLQEVALHLSARLISIFEQDHTNNSYRPVYGGTKQFQEGDSWQNLILFYEYFHGDNGAGLGASHQTGWTGLVAEIINQFTKT